MTARPALPSFLAVLEVPAGTPLCVLRHLITKCNDVQKDKRHDD
jgi:hypothetical protein